MKIDKASMKILDFGNINIDRLTAEVDILVFSGHINEYVREVFEEWRIECGLDDRQGLLLMATVFPIRFYRSLLDTKMGVTFR